MTSAFLQRPWEDSDDIPNPEDPAPEVFLSSPSCSVPSAEGEAADRRVED